MNETPPLPQPSGATCSNCGAAQDTGVPYCTNCGAPMRAVKPAAGLSKTAKVVSSIALGCGALFFGAIGGCFILLGLGDASGLGWLTIGVTATIVLGFFVGIFFVLRK